MAPPRLQELEHALVEGLEKAGELELEQAYVDFLANQETLYRDLLGKPAQ